MKSARNILFSLVIATVVTSSVGCTAAREQIVSRGGMIELLNMSGEDIEVFVDGTRAAIATPGERLLIDKIISGTRTVTIKGTDSAGTITREFDLKVDQAEFWRIDPFQFSTGAGGKKTARIASCSLDVANSASSKVRILINDQEVRTVAPGTRARITGLDAGMIKISAIGDSGETINSGKILLQNGVIPSFAVTTPQSALRILNHSGRPVMIMAPELRLRQIDEGYSTTYAGLTAKKIRFAAVDVSKRIVGAFDVELKPGLATDITVNRPDGVLNVISDMDKPVSVFADGVLLGTCPANGGATFQGLVKGRNMLKSVNHNGVTVTSGWLEIRDEGNLWMISQTSRLNMIAGTGGVEIENTSRENVNLFVDGYMSGQIAPGEKRIVLSLKPGDHAVAVIGKPSDSFVAASLEVKEGETTAWRFAPPVSTLVVRNLRAEAVNIHVDGKMVGTVDATGENSFMIDEGAHRVDINGVSSKTGITRNVSMPTGTTTTLSFSSPFVTIVATNLFSDPVELRVNERLLGELAPGERITVTDIQPGSIRLSAASTKRPVNMAALIDLSAGDAFDWNIAP